MRTPRIAYAWTLPILVSVVLANSLSAQSEQTWTGVLVAATCPGSSDLAANQQMPVSTPGAQRAHNTTYEQQLNQADRNEVSGAATDPGSPAPPKPSPDRDAKCRLTSQTTAFALRLPDGKVVKFDNAANETIAQKRRKNDALQSKSSTVKITVKGSLRENAIAIDTLQL